MSVVPSRAISSRSIARIVARAARVSARPSGLNRTMRARPSAGSGSTCRIFRRTSSSIIWLIDWRVMPRLCASRAGRVTPLAILANSMDCMRVTGGQPARRSAPCNASSYQ